MVNTRLVFVNFLLIEFEFVGSVGFFPLVPIGHH